MKKILLITLIFLTFGVSKASADIVLFDWAFNVNGTFYSFDTVPSVPEGLNFSDFDFDAGLGTLTWTTSGSGLNYFSAFFDHEIDETEDTFYNEYGTAAGTEASGQSWEIDEPGYVVGDIRTRTIYGDDGNPTEKITGNFENGDLDEVNGVPNTSPDDVSMAMGWTFNLAEGFIATITLDLTDEAPRTDYQGFYLAQIDSDSQNAVYLLSALNVEPTGTEPVPEPATMLLLGTGLAGLFGFGRKRFTK